MDLRSNLILHLRSVEVVQKCGNYGGRGMNHSHGPGLANDDEDDSMMRVQLNVQCSILGSGRSDRFRRGQSPAVPPPPTVVSGCHLPSPLPTIV